MSDSTFESFFYLNAGKSNQHVLRLSRASEAQWFDDSGVYNLLSGQYRLHTHWLDRLNQLGNIEELMHDKNMHVLHLSYEAGQEMHSGEREASAVRQPKMIYLQYEGIKKLIALPESMPSKNSKQFVWNEFKGPDRDWYTQAFHRGQRQLRLGQTYQFNLTAPFYYKCNNTRMKDWKKSFLTHTQGRGAFAHATFLGPGRPFIYSNSPECLFQVKKCTQEYVISSMPIKGTMPLGNESWKKLWPQLKNDKKNRAELSMITDLLANDLSGIQVPNAVIRSESSPLVVPGLLHQYSVIEAKIKKSTPLVKIIQSLFPGGSITGAPKFRTMQILQTLESGPRGHYCGSTILAGNGMLSASINIRTAWIDLLEGQMQLGAGGGITVQSSELEEWQEMLAKRDSFLRFLYKTGLFHTQDGKNRLENC